MFKELMKNNAPVDVVKAQTAGGGEEEGTGEDAAASAKDLLMRLPGVNVYNYRNVRDAKQGQACTWFVAMLNARPDLEPEHRSLTAIFPGAWYRKLCSS